MPTPVVMPALGLAQETGRVLTWLRVPGDTVTQGEPLLEIETDKVTVTIEAPATGVLAHVTARAGDVIPVGQAIALVLAFGEPEPAEEVPVAPPPARAATAPPSTREAAPPVEARPVSTPGRRLAASPKARRLAEEHGVNLSALRGTGPGGEILASDVLAAAERAGTEQRGAERAGASPQTGGTVWRLMAERTTQSWTTAPHFFLMREANAQALVRAYDAVRAQEPEATYTDLMIQHIAAALRAHPRLNARWEAGEIVLNEDINIGLAVAVRDGLVVPVVHRADTLSLPAIVAQRRDLVARAQEARLRPEDVRGGTFTFSNLGMYGVDAFQAVINPPQAAILAAGRIAPRVLAVNGVPQVLPTLIFSLSCDHRVVDGTGGARFLDALVQLLERVDEVPGAWP